MSAVDPNSLQWEDLLPRTEPMKILPAHLADFYFEADSEAGEKFSFRAIKSPGGTPFDPSLGGFGGFRISGYLYAHGDRDSKDIDAIMTLEILLEESSNIDKGLDRLSFSIDASVEDNVIQIYDYKAFGLKDPDAKSNR